MPGNTETKKCICCGELSSVNFFPTLPPKMGGQDIPICVSCQQKLYSYISAAVGYKLAMFITAAALNVPYVPEVITKSRSSAKSKGTWGAYHLNLVADGYTKNGGKGWTFVDGLTDFKKAFDGKTEALHVDDEMLNDPDYATGKKASIDMWGQGPAEKPYTPEEYELLNKHYFALTNDRAYISDQTDLAIQGICKLEVLKQRYLEIGDISKAKDIANMIKTEKEGEQLRKKDELPTDRVRLDDIVSAIERAGLHVMDYDELCTELANKSFHATYPYTRDVADQMLLFIRNATAWNEGISEITRLDDEYAIEDNLGEFAEKPDGAQRQIYKDLQLYPLDMKAGDN